MTQFQWIRATLFAAVAGLTMAPVAFGADAQPTSDEECVAQCDTKSDECMAAAGGDDRKEQACDDEYEACLRQCK